MTGQHDSTFENVSDSDSTTYQMQRLQSAMEATQPIAPTQLKGSQTAEGDHTQQCKQPKEAWAKLISTWQHIDNIDLIGAEFSCGRDPSLDFSFTRLLASSSDTKLYKLISRNQFKIVKHEDTGVTTITDESTNGTLVNGQLIGKGNTIALVNNDFIAIGYKKYEVFVFNEFNPPNYPKELLDKVVMTKVTLGKGGYGRVFLASMKGNLDMKVAVKIISHKQLTSSVRFSQAIVKPSDIHNEVNIMRSINHPNCMRFFEFVHAEDHSFIVMELLSGGELFERLISEKNHGMGMGDDLTKFYAWQLLNALVYLHKRKITHRDIKPENIICTSKDEYTIIKLVDFGLAKAMTDMEADMKTKCGTPAYTAPEMLHSTLRLPYTEKVDVWSLGVVLFMVAVGYPPFSPDYGDISMDEQIKTGRLVFHAPWKLMPQSTQQAISRMLYVNPNRRPTAYNLLSGAWLEGEAVEHAKRMVKSHSNSNNSHVAPL